MISLKKVLWGLSLVGIFVTTPLWAIGGGPPSTPASSCTRSLPARCPTGKRCVVETIPITTSGIINDSTIQLSVSNTSEITQDVIVEVFTKRDFGIDNQFLAGFLSYPSTLWLDTATCSGPVVFGICGAGYRYACSKTTSTSIDAGETIHHLFHLKLNNVITPDERSSTLAMIHVTQASGAVKAMMTINYNSPFVGIGTGAFGGFVGQIHQYFLNAGKPF